MTNLDQDRLHNEAVAVKTEIRLSGARVMSCRQFPNGTIVIVSGGSHSYVYVLTVQAGTVATRLYSRMELIELLTLNTD